MEKRRGLDTLTKSLPLSQILVKMLGEKGLKPVFSFFCEMNLLVNVKLPDLQNFFKKVFIEILARAV